MYPVKSGYKKLLLQTGLRVCPNVLHYNFCDKKSSDDVKLPPEPTTCCMSGCANCVWIDYAKTIAVLLDENTDKVREMVLDKIEDPNLKIFLSLELKNIQFQRELEQKQTKLKSTAENTSNSDETKSKNDKPN